MSSSPPPGRGSRARKLFSLAAKLGQSEATQRIRQVFGASDSAREVRTRIEQATQLVKTLSQLKGAAMKVGQLLSIEAADFMPPEVVTILSQLQDKAEPLKFSEIESILKNELGPRFSELEEISVEALATASIGQVHRARYRGRNIVLKIQYPGISEAIDSDIDLLRKLAGTLLTLGQRKVQLDPLFAEFRKVLEGEADYALEGKALESYRANLPPQSGYIVPELFSEISTTRVLAMSYEPGIRVQDWLRSNPPAESRRYFGQKILDLYALEFFKVGLVQTDPNFGNFLFRPSAKEIVLLDFGATRSYTPEFRMDYRRLLWKVRHGTSAEVVDLSVAMGLIQPQESAECLAAFVEMLRISLAPFAPEAQPFDFGNLDYAREVRNKTLAFTKLVRFSAPPHQLIFLHRKLGGIFSLLKTLKVDIDLTPYWNSLVSPVANEP